MEVCYGSYVIDDEKLRKTKSGDPLTPTDLFHGYQQRSASEQNEPRRTKVRAIPKPPSKDAKGHNPTNKGSMFDPVIFGCNVDIVNWVQVVEIEDTPQSNESKHCICGESREGPVLKTSYCHLRCSLNPL